MYPGNNGTQPCSTFMLGIEADEMKIKSVS